MKVIVIFVALFGACCGSTKQWQSNVNFNNPKNWDTGKIPCASNRIVFPGTVNSVLLQTNISSIKELILPSNGQIFLPSDMSLTFSDDNAASQGCDGGDINFVRTNLESWFDPNNWQDQEDLVTVETERVPCQYDSVVYPEEKLFNVGLDSAVTVGQMKFSGQDYNSVSFATFLDSETGKIQFSTTTGASVTVRGSTCPVTSGCACGNDDEATMSKICNLYTCLATSCKEAVTPIGGCCPLCGAILTMDFDPASFNMASFKQRMQDNYLSPDNQSGRRKRREVATSDVDMYTSKTSNDKIQMVVTDRVLGSSSGQTAINLAQQIMTDIQADPGSFGVTSVAMKSSTQGTGSQTGGIQGGAVVGIIIAVLVVVVVICTVGFFLRRRKVFFSKDMPLHADMEVAPDIPVSFMEEIPGQPQAMYMQSFDNPVYATPSAQDNLYDDPTRLASLDLTLAEPQALKKGSGKKAPETLDQYDAGFDNPIYGQQMESGIDELKVEMEKEEAKEVDLGLQESES